MTIRLPTRFNSCLTILLCLLLLVGCGKQAPPTVEAFLKNHWADPLPPQGAPPAAFSRLEASLAPEACGQCHAEQFEAWRDSLHSKAMGPGLLWQLQLMDQAQGNRCLRCHTPLAEQKALLALEMGWSGAPKQAPPAYVPQDLAHQGLVCAACHVRGQQRIGPPPRGEKLAQAPHGGFIIAEAFQDSRFCAHCHQFPDDGPRIAGKLQEDTYRQWLATPYAKDGPGKQTCQGCHMPDRRHLWRGIHDAEMTRRALDVSMRLIDLGGNRYEARATVRNSGAGHHFPTYMVAKAEVQFVLRDANRRERLLAKHVIGWQVDTGITRELADTRLVAGEERTYRQRLQAPASGDWQLVLIIHIAPGEHYERIYRDSLTRVDQFPATVEPLLRRALTDAESKRYQLLRLEAGPGQAEKAKPIAN